jgi:hypothetical protein
VPVVEGAFQLLLVSVVARMGLCCSMLLRFDLLCTLLGCVLPRA